MSRLHDALLWFIDGPFAWLVLAMIPFLAIALIFYAVLVGYFLWWCLG